MSTPELLESQDSTSRQPHRTGRRRDGAGPRELAPARRPHARGTVDRPRLVAPLVQAPRPLALLVAPAGWGKSTVLAQWRRAERRPLHLLALGRAHDDVAALEASVATALADLGVVAAPGDLADAFAGLGPCVLVLDGVESLRSQAARELVARLAERVPAGGTLALASRTDPDLPLGLRRSRDDVVELRAGRLAMTPPEAMQLLRITAPGLTERDAVRLHELTEGWPCALRLAARAVAEQNGAVSAVRRFGGDDTVVTEYVREEVLAPLQADERTFLRRVSVLERLTGPTCDAALGRRGGAPLLRRLARSGVPLVALDRAESGYRMHPLLAEALRAELRHVEPELEPCLHDRLSRWYEAEGDVELAIEHAVSARDGCRAGALLADHAAGFAAGGRADLLRVWLQRLGDAQIARSPALAAAAAVSALAHGEADIAERWAILALQTPADGAEQPAIIRPAAALVRALCAPLGVDAMIAEAQSALNVLPAQGPWRSLAHLTEGTARLLAGHADAATARLEEGARAAIFDAPLIRALCLAQLAVLALDRDDHDDAAAIATRAVSTLERASCAEHALAALPLAASALAHVQRHRPDEAAAELADAMRRMRRLDDAPAWYGALLRALLAPTAMRLGDVGDGRRLLADAARMCRQVPGAVALQGSIERTWAQADERTGGPGAPPSTLTRAELRVLRLLPSHLSFREIGAELHVSANTVKTQAHAIYRKLDARSRSEAVTHAAAAGLVDDTRLS